MTANAASGTKHWWILGLVGLGLLGFGLQRQLRRVWRPPLEASDDLTHRVVHRLQTRHPEVFGDWQMPNAAERQITEPVAAAHPRIHPSRLTLPHPLRFEWPQVKHIARYRVEVTAEASDDVLATATSKRAPITLSFDAKPGATYRWRVFGTSMEAEPLVEQTFACLSEAGVARYKRGRDLIDNQAPRSIRAAMRVFWAWHFGLWDRAFAIAEARARNEPSALVSETLSYLERRTGWTRRS